MRSKLNRQMLSKVLWVGSTKLTNVNLDEKDGLKNFFWGEDCTGGLDAQKLSEIISYAIAKFVWVSTLAPPSWYILLREYCTMKATCSINYQSETTEIYLEDLKTLIENTPLPSNIHLPENVMLHRINNDLLFRLIIDEKVHGLLRAAWLEHGSHIRCIWIRRRPGSSIRQRWKL